MSTFRCERCGTGADVPEYRTAGGRRVLMHQYTYGDEVKVYCEDCANRLHRPALPNRPGDGLMLGPRTR